MALPPEQINIKRRREEEPVETLYIQSALHQTKRRFTDFAFQRVLLNDDGGRGLPASVPAQPAAQRALRSPRSVSSLQLPSQRSRSTAQTTSPSGVPLVRATLPGAELREAKRVVAAQKEAEEKYKRALYSSPASLPAPAASATAAATATTPTSLQASSEASVAPSTSRTHSVRRFQISRSSSPSLGSLRGVSAGIQKRRADGPAPGVAVLVEQLRRKPHSQQASMVAELAVRAQADAITAPVKQEPAAIPEKPRKRPVVNQAERRWREERKGAISAAKQHLSDALEKSAQAHNSNWDAESERLAREFEQVALELDRDGDMEVNSYDLGSPEALSASSHTTPGAVPKPPLKYQPRLPKQPRAVQTTSQPSVEEHGEMGEIDDARTQPDADDRDGDYVYDVYIRRPLAEGETLTSPLAEFEADEQRKSLDAARPGVGVIVITAEDEEYWEHFVEDDEEEWDSEDADSNAENNPANDYPEELSSDDDNDDPSAVYGRYRHRAVSDDEEFDFDDSASEDARQFGAGYGRPLGHVGTDSDDY